MMFGCPWLMSYAIHDFCRVRVRATTISLLTCTSIHSSRKERVYDIRPITKILTQDLFK